MKNHAKLGKPEEKVDEGFKDILNIFTKDKKKKTHRFDEVLKYLD